MNDQKLIIESQYFPCIAWMTMACHAQVVWIDMAENYNKRSLRNKTWLNQTENQLALSIPLRKGKHGGKGISEVMISFETNWQLNHIRAIQSTYGKSPYFIHYAEEIFNLINQADHHLIKFTYDVTQRIIEFLEMNVKLIEQKEFVKNSNEKFHVLRDQFKYTGEYSFIESAIESEIRKQDGQTHLPFLPSPRSSFLDLLFYLGPETRLFINKIHP